VAEVAADGIEIRDQTGLHAVDLRGFATQSSRWPRFFVAAG
jgi:hypothetical protein